MTQYFELGINSCGFCEQTGFELKESVGRPVGSHDDLKQEFVGELPSYAKR
jgi:hypothetical protein